VTTASSAVVPGSTTANSSPPSRAGTSSGRRAAVSRCPSTRSRWSPAWCPSVSLTSLNRSRSNSRSATGEPSVRSRTSCARSASCERFGRPVSASVRASRSRCSETAATLYTASRAGSSSGTKPAPRSMASTTSGDRLSSAPLLATSWARSGTSTSRSGRPTDSAIACVTSSWLTTKYTTAPAAAAASMPPSITDSRSGDGAWPVQAIVTAAAVQHSEYWPMLNAVRQGALRLDRSATSTAAAWASSATARP